MTGRRGYVDPVLVALSDALVLVALERAWSRVVPRSQRGAITGEARHEGYLRAPIRVDRIDRALEAAWTSAALLAGRHGLEVDPNRWADLLDGYTRALIMACEPHLIERLRPHLAPLAVAEPWVRPFVRVAV